MFRRGRRRRRWSRGEEALRRYLAGMIPNRLSSGGLNTSSREGSPSEGDIGTVTVMGGSQRRRNIFARCLVAGVGRACGRASGRGSV